MGRPRSAGNKHNPPGFYLYPKRNAYIQMPGMPKVDLGTDDRTKALALYWEFRRTYDTEQAERQARELADKLKAAAMGGPILTVAAYAKTFRETHLPTLLKKNGRPLSDSTREDYERMLRNQVEEHEAFKTTAIAAVRVRPVREYLAQWITKPNYYNYMRALLSRMFQLAVDEGKLDANPADSIPNRAVAVREVYCPMDHYLAITAELEEWERRICDLVYLVSHNPCDVLALEDKAPDITYDTIDGVQCVVVTLARSKTHEGVQIYEPLGVAGGIEETLQWFRDWKKSQWHIPGSSIAVYPKNKRRYGGQGVSVEYLSRRVAEAVVAAGLDKGAYQLRDLRKKALTDEARIVGKETDKGAHKTERMKKRYVVGGIVRQVPNNLTVLRRAKI